MFVYIPEKREFLMAEEGSGDNLLPEDIEEGYVDYMYIETYSWSGVHGDLIEEDGGQFMLKEAFVEKYGSEGTKHFNKELMIKDAMDLMYGRCDYHWLEIYEKEE